MPTYTVTNTRGDVVASIGVATTTGDQYPIELIGQGISLYGPIVASTQYRLMENFADDDFLTNDPNVDNVPEGLIQYRYDQKIPYIFDGTNWIRIATGFSSASVLFSMQPSAENFDFGLVPARPAIFVPPVIGFSYYPTGLLLIPRTTGGTGSAIFSLGTATSGDEAENLLESNIVEADGFVPDEHIYLPLNGRMKTITSADEIYLNITQAVDAPATLTFDVLLFGFIAG